MMRFVPVFVLLLSAAVRLHSANSSDFKPLWDGTSLRGWHPIGKGEWKIEAGAIHGTNNRTNKHYGHLVTDRAYTNFVVRFKFKAVKGNSGFYFRSEEKGSSGISGFQAEVAAVNDVGGLYETNGRGWVIKPRAARVREWFKPGEWNEMSVSALGTKITVHVNGKQSAALPDDTLSRSHGRLALQVHGGEDVDVWFKDIEIAEK